MDTWKRKQMHSHIYRTPEPFHNEVFCYVISMFFFLLNQREYILFNLYALSKKKITHATIYHNYVSLLILVLKISI